MTNPHPPKEPASILAWLWKITAHPVIAGLVVAGVLTVLGVNLATNRNDNNSIPHGPGLGHSTAQPTSSPGHSTTQRTTSPTPAPAPPCPKKTASSADPVREATGPPPWTVEGYGIRYTVVSVTRGATNDWAGTPKPSITVTSCVTRIQPADNPTRIMTYRFSDVASSSKLEPLPLPGSVDEDPPLNQTSRLITILWDVAPSATHLTITAHDVFWPDSHNLTLQNVPVSRQS
ncbi:hypothetical protein QMK19_21060 [Streptomyces sp. H10-C2]|uniref:hypothetical protein n=1 Tax=unclassified Streptomyces TaxID=2593676 RepID=UPI0024B9D7A4|nr:MULTISPECIES: hypothetical protein [unclassified Streptomyces]MDJ0344430.1 hypothetical protein [Streptomyces sp. PH10-H1]MDJ0372094.1 hypothetical protein [Streptomyces sp. H10-C2]